MKWMLFFLALGTSAFSQPMMQEETCPVQFQVRNLVVSVVKSEQGNAEFSIQAVPVGTDLFLNVNAPREGNYSVEVYDATGKLLNQAKSRLIATTFSQKLSFAEYPGGIYMLKVTNEDAPASKLLRIIK